MQAVNISSDFPQNLQRRVKSHHHHLELLSKRTLLTNSLRPLFDNWQVSWPITLNKQFPWTMVWASHPVHVSHATLRCQEASFLYPFLDKSINCCLVRVMTCLLCSFNFFLSSVIVKRLEPEARRYKNVQISQSVSQRTPVPRSSKQLDHTETSWPS